MSSTFHFKCDTCDFCRDIAYLPRDYVFSDGRRMHMLQRHIWCSRCNAITVAEGFHEESQSREIRLDFRERHRRELERNEFKHEYEGDLRKKWIADSEQYDRDLVEWKSRRRRPPFCLKCGNEDIIVPEKNWSDLPHPGCGGTLKCTATIIGGTFIAPEPHKYTIEGELIELGYWEGPFENDQRKPLDLWWPDGA